MTNRLVVGILILLVAMNGAIGAYAYTLKGEIDELGAQLADFQAQEAAREGEVRQELATLGRETAGRLDSVEQSMAASQALIDTIERRLEEDSDRFAELESGLAGIAGELAGLGPGLEADVVYRAVSQTVVQVSDGESTVGSGFIYDGNGHVVTAYHVIEGLDEVYVVLADGRTSRARLVGGSRLSDVAVLDVEREHDVAPAVLADSSQLRVGEPVLAIGSPLELGGTVTVGVVSQLDRFEDIDSAMEGRAVANLIQFDAAANFGNSGGPLFNAAGEVIGLIVARVKPDIGDGISYAVSSNKVKRVADAIIEHGSFAYPWLGVEVADLTPQDAEAAGRETILGAVVGRVAPGSPAQAAGLRAGDIITGINDTAVDEVADLTAYLGEHASPDDVVVLKVERNGVILELTATLAVR